jgi:sulfotransferase family protein
MIRLTYILAASHSGSTLLAMLLGAHPDVCTVGELKWTSMGDVDRYRCSCGALIKECPFWSDVRSAMQQRGFEFELRDPRTDVRAGTTAYERRLLGPLHRGRTLEGIRDLALRLSPGWSARLREHQERNRALMATVLSRTGKDVLVDSSKIGIRLKYLLRIPGVDIRVVRMIRDGRAVALTYTDPAVFADARNPSLKGGGSGASRDHQRLSMEDAAREWRRSNEEAAAILSQVPQQQWTTVRYEELCANPEPELGRLFSFIGVDPSKSRMDFRSTDHHVVGNGMRLDTTSEIRVDERWRDVLGPTELRTFSAVAGALNRGLGYA